MRAPHTTSTWALHVSPHVVAALWPESHMLTPGPHVASCERGQEHVPWGKAISRCAGSQRMNEAPPVGPGAQCRKSPWDRVGPRGQLWNMRSAAGMNPTMVSPSLWT